MTKHHCPFSDIDISMNICYVDKKCICTKLNKFTIDKDAMINATISSLVFGDDIRMEILVGWVNMQNTEPRYNTLK